MCWNFWDCLQKVLAVTDRTDLPGSYYILHLKSGLNAPSRCDVSYFICGNGMVLFVAMTHSICGNDTVLFVAIHTASFGAMTRLYLWQ